MSDPQAQQIEIPAAFQANIPDADGSEMMLVKAVLLGDMFPSQQVKGKDADITDAIAGQEVIPPPVDLDLLASCLDISSRLGRCIRTFARNTCGFGWEIQPKDLINDDTPDETVAAVEAQAKKLRRVFSTPNLEMSFTKILELVCIDEEAVGNGYIEVVRNTAGEISSLYHVPGRTVRILKGGVGYVQIREGERVFFKNFRDREAMHAETGDRKGMIPAEKRATELYPFKVESVRSSWYGIPRWYSTIPAIAGNRYAAMRNVAFFENDACPRLIITVTGGKLLPESVAVMRKFFELRGKGAANAHRVCVLQAEPRHPGAPTGMSKVDINVEKLTIGTEDEASFRKYQEANNEEIREAFGIARIFFAPSGSNRANAVIERQITNEQEFEPARIDKEYCFNTALCADILGGGLHTDLADHDDVLVTFRLKRPKFTDPSEQAEIHRKYASAGVMTPNEIRQELGFSPFPKGLIFADKPVNVALTEMQISPAMAKAGLIPLVGEFIDGTPTTPKTPNTQPTTQEPKPSEKTPMTPEEIQELLAMKKFMQEALGKEVLLKVQGKLLPSTE